MMWPYWYVKREKQELAFMFIGMGIAVVMGVFEHYFLMWMGYLLLACGPVSQHLRFKRMKWLEEETLRCECGGLFVLPWDLGFAVQADHLICDNDKGLGPLGACTNFIITPSNYHNSEFKEKPDIYRGVEEKAK